MYQAFTGCYDGLHVLVRIVAIVGHFGAFRSVQHQLLEGIRMSDYGQLVGQWVSRDADLHGRQRWTRFQQAFDRTCRCSIIQFYNIEDDFQVVKPTFVGAGSEGVREGIQKLSLPSTV